MNDMTLSMGLSPETIINVLNDLLLLQEDIVDEESFQDPDWGLIISNLDDIIKMCKFAIEKGYKNDI